MNSVNIIGNLCADPELRTSQNGIAATRITVAVNRMPNANGERIADYINVVVWRKQAENLVKYCSKGSKIAVEGRIQTRSYDAQDGSKRYVMEVVAEHITFLSSSKQSSATANNCNQTANVSPTQVQAIETTEEDVFQDFANEVVINEDDLPF